MSDTLIPVDFESAGMIPDRVLSTRCVRRVPEGVRLTAVIDACHSGTELDLPWMWLPDRGVWKLGCRHSFLYHLSVSMKFLEFLGTS